MKAGILLAAVALIGAALWFSGLTTPPARNLLITEASASPMGDSAAVVLTIDNQGAPDALVGVSSTFADAMFRNADRGLPIPVGVSSLALDAAHIVVAPSDTPLEDGTLIPLTLEFALAGEVPVKARFMVPEPGSMAAHMAMGHGGMTQDVTEAPFPTLTLSATPDADGWSAAITTTNFTFAEDLQDGAHVPGTGHGHIYIGDMKLGRVFSDSYAIGALPKGRHTLRVTLNTNNHRAYAVDGKLVAAETIIEVD